MKLKIYAFLVHPGRNVTSPPQISGNRLPSSGKLFDLLSGIFHATPNNRDFSVTFRPDASGRQKNECRDLLLKYMEGPNKTSGMAVAKRLQAVSDNRSGIGLLFLMAGQHSVQERLVVSRFPADEAILAEVSKSGLDVEYLERVFIKRMTAYKALMLEHKNPPKGFWSGMVTDRQVGSTAESISNYWLSDFLTADFSETPQAGTRRLAEALRAAIKNHPRTDIKGEIASAISVAPRMLAGKSVSIDEFCKTFALSPDATLTIRNQLAKPSLADIIFQFDSQEFKKRVPFRTIEMDTGAILSGPSDEFPDLFEKTVKPSGEIIYSTRGKVEDERMARR